MPRPRTKGDPIQIRLPLDTDERLRDRADGLGLTPAEYVESLLILAVTNLLEYIPGVPGSTERQVRDSDITGRFEIVGADTAREDPNGDVGFEADHTCRHKNVKVLNGGMATCFDCDMVRNTRGEWVPRATRR